jgi:ankyrin repeat protein
LLCVPLALGCFALCASCSKESETRLFDAVGEGDVNEIRAAIRDGFDVNGKDEHGYTPLALASMNGDLEAVRALLAMGANPNSTDVRRQPIFLASVGGYRSVVEELLRNMPNIHRDQYAVEALAHARDVAIARALIHAGVDVDGGVTLFGFAPIHLAAAGSRVEIVDLLIRSGADVELKNERGQSALHLACQAFTRDPMPQSEPRARATVRRLLEAEADPRARDLRDNTPLHYAARSFVCGPEIVRLLLEKGASPRDVNLSGATPFMAAYALGKNPSHPSMVLLAQLEGLNLAKLPPRKSPTVSTVANRSAR